MNEQVSDTPASHRPLYMLLTTLSGSAIVVALAVGVAMRSI
jgi:hypothetical protein